MSSKKKRIILIVAITMVALIIRCLWLNGKSGDYLFFLKIWVDDIRSLGYFKSLAYEVGNYNVPYMVLLVFISLLKCAPLYPIKFLSIIFDFICAIYGYKIVKLVSKNDIASLITYILILMLPTVIVNGAMWGQCDSIYTSFILISLYCLLQNKYTKSFIFLGVSFAFKLQFIFILPLYILMFFREKKIHIYHFLIIPLVNIIMCLPALIMGRSFKDVMLIYFDQTVLNPDLEMNFPNLYNLIEHNNMFVYKYGEIISKVGIIITILLFFIIWLYVIINKVKFDKEKIISVGLWSVVIAVYFLPHMHDRYMFVADILSVVWFLIYQKKVYVPIIINAMSMLTYFIFLFRIKYLDFRIASIIFFVVILLYTIYVLKLLGENNGNRKNKLESK